MDARIGGRVASHWQPGLEQPRHPHIRSGGRFLSAWSALIYELAWTISASAGQARRGSPAIAGRSHAWREGPSSSCTRWSLRRCREDASGTRRRSRFATASASGQQPLQQRGEGPSAAQVQALTTIQDEHSAAAASPRSVRRVIGAFCCRRTASISTRFSPRDAKELHKKKEFVAAQSLSAFEGRGGATPTATAGTTQRRSTPRMARIRPLPRPIATRAAPAVRQFS